MKFIVCVTSGQYSNYDVDTHLVGDEDPVAVLDAMSNRMSGGRWPKFDEIELDSDSRTHKLERDIRHNAVDELKRHGYIECKAIEVWIGRIITT